MNNPVQRLPVLRNSLVSKGPAKFNLSEVAIQCKPGQLWVQIESKLHRDHPAAFIAEHYCYTTFCPLSFYSR